MVADVAIAGAGPAGAALAIELGRRGVRVALYEKSRRPRLKACGEGILPHGVEALEAIAGNVPDGVPIRGLRFVVGDRSIESDFPVGAGLVVRRDRLQTWLLERAAATPDVDLRIGTSYVPDGERLVVGADGTVSMFHRRLPARRPSVKRVGLTTHVAGLSGVTDRVEVFFHRLGELYVAPTVTGEAMVAALLHQETFRRDAVTYLIGDIPELRARASRLHVTSPVLAAAPLGLDVPRVVDAGLLLIGDAAGAPDPITGDGMALAFASVKVAADAIVNGRLDDYQRARRASGRSSSRLGRLLIGLGRHLDRPRLLGAVLDRPRFVSTLLDVAVGRRPMGLATLVRGVV